MNKTSSINYVLNRLHIYPITEEAKEKGLCPKKKYYTINTTNRMTCATVTINNMWSLKRSTVLGIRKGLWF
jgi:hypothetical protein